MEYDFCFIASWSKQSQRQLITWGTELEARGYTVAIVSPSYSKLLSETDLTTFVLKEFEDSVDEFPSVETIESRYEIPSLDHIIFSEQQYYDLTRSEALSRAVQLAASFEKLFSKHQFEYTFQGRGPEIHRLLGHYLTESIGKTSIWVEFSPFDDSFALTTSLKGRWDHYQTVLYEEISEQERKSTRQHIEAFREDRRFYAQNEGTSDENSRNTIQVVKQAIKTIQSVIGRKRPGRLQDQIKQEAVLELNRRVNDYLLPTVQESRELCKETNYVFFPLQYPIESRLTVFSPQFFDQLYLVEYLARILPSSVELFVKAHPHHPGRPAPKAMRQLVNNDRITFLHYNTHAHEIIQNAEAVVVVNNTIGYESIYFQKPLIALGDPTYAETPAVTKVDALENLPAVLKEHVSTTISEETTVESIYSLQKTTWRGDITSYDSENIHILVDSILEFLDE